MSLICIYLRKINKKRIQSYNKFNYYNIDKHKTLFFFNFVFYQKRYDEDYNKNSKKMFSFNYYKH